MPDVKKMIPSINNHKEFDFVNYSGIIILSK